MAITTKDAAAVKISDFTSQGLIVDANKKNTIRIDDFSQEDIDKLSFSIDGDYLVIAYNNNKLLVKNYGGIKYIKTDYDDSGKKPTYNLTDIIEAQLVNNYNEIKYNKSKKAYLGTKYNDTFESTENAETFTGGLGQNTYNYYSGGGDDTINLTKGEALLINLSGVNLDNLDFAYANKNKDLVIYTNNSHTDSLTLKNFVLKDVLGENGSITLAGSNFCIDLKEHLIKHTINGNYIGTRLNEILDASGAEKQYKIKKKTQVEVPLIINGGAGNDSIIGSFHKDSIIGGIGNDTILGSLDSDFINAGKGENKIIYSLLKELDGDIITLTKDETLLIDISEFSPESVKYEKDNNNLKVIVSKNEETASFIIKDFVKKDVVGNNGDVKIKFSNGRTDLLKSDNIFSDTSKIYTTGSDYNGSWLSETIDAEGEVLYKDKIHIVPKTETDKGLKINAGDGNDFVIGTKYSDNILGGAGNDQINGGTGNDTVKGGAGNDTIFGNLGNDLLYGEAGDDLLCFNKGDGSDIVYSGKGIDTISLMDSSIADVSLTKVGKDLKIEFSESDSILVKNYYKSGNSVRYLKTTEGAFDLTNIIYSSGEINGTVDSDIILGSSGKDTIYGLKGNDTIVGGKGNDYLNGGLGNSTFIFKAGDGIDTITSGQGIDTVTLDSNYSVNTTKDGDNLIINYNNNQDKIVLKDYFKENHSVQKIKRGIGPIENISDYIVRIQDSGIINGTIYRDSIVGSSGSDTITAGITNSDYDLVKPMGGNDEIIVQENGKLIISLSNNLGDKIIKGVACSDKVFIDVKPSDILYGYQDGEDYIIKRKYAVNNTSQTDTLKIKNFSYEEANNKLSLCYSQDTTAPVSLSSIDLGEDYTPESELNIVDNNLYESADNVAHYILGDTDNDTILSGSGNDIIRAFDGNNLVETSGGDNNISANDGNDTLTSGNGNDTIFAGNGNNIVLVSGGNNNIITGSGNDSITINGNGTNIIYSGDGKDTVTGSNGDDEIHLVNGNYNIVTSNSGNDTIYGENCNFSTLDGGAGNDSINVGEGHHNTIIGGLGDDIIQGSSYVGGYVNYYCFDKNGVGADTISVQPSNNWYHDNIKFTGFENNEEETAFYEEIKYYKQNNDLIIKYAENGTIAIKDYETMDMYHWSYIRSNGDTSYIATDLTAKGISIEGSSNDDILNAPLLYESTINGWAGNDTINVNGKNATINGGSGNNVINISNANSEITSVADGNDCITINSGNAKINILGGNNSITSTADSGSEDIISISGEGETSVYEGNGYNEITINSTGATTIQGGVGNDSIVANSGTNNIKTGEGQDFVTITGGENSLVMENTYESFVTVTGGENTITSNSAGRISYNIDGGENTLTLQAKDNYDYVTISGGINSIIGSNSNDRLKVIGGENDINTKGGVDFVTIQGGENTLNLGAGNDNVYVYNSVTPSLNIIYGGLGSDYIYAESGNNTIYGGLKPLEGDYAGEDTDSNSIYVYSKGLSLVYAGNKNDYIEAGSSEYNSENSTTTYYGNNTIYGGTGNDEISVLSSNFADVIGGAGKDVIKGSLLSNVIDGGEGNDTIYVNGNTNTINGGEGDDYIYSNYNRTGLDSIVQSAVITGGEGNDEILLSRYISETLHFSKGHGNDTINYSNSWSKESQKNDILVFDDSNLDELFVKLDNSVNGYGDLLIMYNNGQECIKIDSFAEWYSGNIHSTISKIITKDFPEGISISEFINTRSIFEIKHNAEADYNSFSGTYLSDSIIGTAHADLIYGNKGNDTILGGIGNDTIDGQADNDLIYGGAGADIINDTQGNNLIIGGQGNDSIIGHTDIGNYNTYNFYQNDGVDTISSYSSESVLNFEVESLDDIKISYDREKSAFVLSYSENDKVYLVNSYDAEYDVKLGIIGFDDPPVSLQVLAEEKHIIFPNGVVSDSYIEGTEEDDYIYLPTNNNSTVLGGQGNDTIDGNGSYTVNYVYDMDINNGNDVILNSNLSSESCIVFKGVGNGMEDYTAHKNFLETLEFTINGNDLIIAYGEPSQTITIKDYKAEDYSSSIDSFVFYYPEAEEGYQYSGEYSFDDYLHITYNPGTTSIEGHNYNEKIIGTSGDDTINPGGGNSNKIKPLEGADTIEFRTQYFENGDVNTVKNIVYMGTDETPDVLWFKDITLKNNINVYRDENDLKVQAGERNGYGYWIKTLTEVTLKDYFTYAKSNDSPTYMEIKIGDGEGENSFMLTSPDIYTNYISNYKEDQKLETVEGTALNDWIETSNEIDEVVYGGKGNDIIEPRNSNENPGADEIHGGLGNDSINYSGIGNIGVKVYGDEGNDTIIASKGVVYGGAGSDLISVRQNGVSTGVIIYGGNDSFGTGENIGDKDTITGYYGDDLIYGGIGDDLIYGSDGNDTIYGGGGNDTIFGEVGDTTIYGGEGNDLIYSYNENNKTSYWTYNEKSEIRGGNGNDTIYSVASNNQLWGDAGDDVIYGQKSYGYNGFHLKSGDGHDTIYTSSADRHNREDTDRIFFDDIDFDDDNIKAELSGGDVIVYYDYNSLAETWDSSITIKDYLALHEDYNYLCDAEGNILYDNEGNPRYDYYESWYECDDIYDLGSSSNILIDKTGKVLKIRELVYMPEVAEGDINSSTIFNDNITLDEEASYLYGKDGHDTIVGNDINNELYGDSGNDFLIGGRGSNNLYGGIGDDTIVSGYNKIAHLGYEVDTHRDVIYGGIGNNIYDIRCVQSNSVIAEVNSISETDEFRIEGHSTKSIYTFEGNDLVLSFAQEGSENFDKFIIKNWKKNPYNYKLVFSDTTTTLIDNFKGHNSYDYIDYVNGNSHTGDELCTAIFGSSNSDTINADISSEGTNKWVVSGDGNDSITTTGSNYNAVIYGGKGNDTIDSNSSKGLFIDGEIGDDSIITGSGNDTIYGGIGADTITAGSGNDVIFAGKPSMHLSETIDEILTKSSYEEDEFEILEKAGVYTNKIYGNEGNDTIVAIGENSILNGGEGDDDYHVVSSNNNQITDNFGSNTLTVHGMFYGRNMNVFMNITSEGLIEDNTIYVSEDMSYWLNNNASIDENSEYGVTKLLSGTSTVTTIFDDNCSISMSTIESFIEEVASWLGDNGFADVSKALSSADEDKVYEIKDMFITMNEHYQGQYWSG